MHDNNKNLGMTSFMYILNKYLNLKFYLIYLQFLLFTIQFIFYLISTTRFTDQQTAIIQKILLKDPAFKINALC